MCGPNSEMGNDVRVGLMVLKKLLSRGVEVACVDRDGRPPLLWAASGGSSDAILALVKSGAEVNAVDRDGLTALHCAASRGHVDCLETLITLCGAQVDKVDVSGCSALFYAVTLGHADCTNLLLSFGSQGNRQDNKGRTPAHCGAAKGQLETLKILNHHKANLWMRNSKGDMPLHEAVQSGRKDLVEWLLQHHQGSVNVSNSNGRTPLHIAALTNNVDMCKVLMDYGAFINPIMKNSKNQHLTPLDAALHRGNRGCAKYLNLHGALPASKLLEKREYNRQVLLSYHYYKFTETRNCDTLELSPITKRNMVRDTSAQTEPNLKDVDIQAQVDQKNVSAAADFSRGTSPADSAYARKNFRCSAADGSTKPIIAKVYVHTKRSKIRGATRKPTAYRRDCLGEKLQTREQHRSHVNFQCPENRASNNQGDTETPQQTDLEKKPNWKKRPTEAEAEDHEQFKQYNQEDSGQYNQEDNEQYSQEDDRQYNKEDNQHEDHVNGEFHHEDDENRSQLLPIEQTRRSSLRTKEYDYENHSPLSSIRSLESTIKDSGFSDDVDRGHQPSSSDEDDDDDRGGHSDSEGNYGRRRSKRHIARYFASLEKKESLETCPRLLNRPTLTKEVQRSLKKYQMERRLFYELQELKRKQITSSLLEEKEVVQKMIERFRNHVLSPYMTDFQGPLTFKAFEKYLYGNFLVVLF
ncbi:inversin-A [Caerostris extrusa]|uniref:Alpha-latrotoxin n=1 Tax=Caerostris extrusa TaxID=172846 RepID=A0AAV4SCC8_CAEEX|nr:inversin-A [Caerostris extrusa]